MTAHDVATMLTDVRYARKQLALDTSLLDCKSRADDALERIEERLSRLQAADDDPDDEPTPLEGGRCPNCGSVVRIQMCQVCNHVFE